MIANIRFQNMCANKVIFLPSPLPLLPVHKPLPSQTGLDETSDPLVHEEHDRV